MFADDMSCMLLTLVCKSMSVPYFLRKIYNRNHVLNEFSIHTFKLIERERERKREGERESFHFSPCIHYHELREREREREKERERERVRKRMTENEGMRKRQKDWEREILPVFGCCRLEHGFLQLTAVFECLKCTSFT